MAHWSVDSSLADFNEKQQIAGAMRMFDATITPERPLELETPEKQISKLKKYLEDLKLTIAKKEKNLANLQSKRNKILDGYKEEIKKLREEENVLKFGRKEPQINITDVQLEEMSKSLINVSLVSLKRFTRFDMMQIVLARETLLYKTINKYEEGMKHNDRRVFKSLKDEAKRVHSYLLNSNKAYLELTNLKRELKEQKMKTRTAEAKVRAQDLVLRDLRQSIRRTNNRLIKKDGFTGVKIDRLWGDKEYEG